MRSTALKELLAGLPVTPVRGDLGLPVTCIVYDSRDAVDGALFVAMDGAHTDGCRFAADAVQRGARAVLAARLPDGLPDSVAVLLAADPRGLLSPLAAAFHGRPSRSIRVVGVTGTDGKSSTVAFIDQLLTALGRKSGFLSTVSFKTTGPAVKNPFRQSTPEATEIHGMLREMVDAGLEYAVVEATSHGLSRKTGRLADVLFDAAVLTNVTHEHLEFHGSFDKYRSDKANLFRALDRPAGKQVQCPPFGIVNADDPSADYFRGCTAAPVLSYSGRPGPRRAPAAARADLAAEDMRVDIGGTSFMLASPSGREPARLNIPGPFWVENSLAACLTVSRLLDRDPLALAPLLARLAPVKGRMEFVDRGQPFALIVDYAHTPGAFARLFPWVREHAAGRITAVFGSAGERDREKRPLQGRIAAEMCDTVILADEDPRGEDAMAILEQIAAGCTGKTRGEDLFLVPDRMEAIRLAVSRAGPGDVVLLLGKGHEGSIIGPRGAADWDERSAAEKALAEGGYGA